MSEKEGKKYLEKKRNEVIQTHAQISKRNLIIIILY